MTISDTAGFPVTSHKWDESEEKSLNNSLSIAARRFFEEPHSFCWSGGSSGLSGSGFAQVEAGDEVWCLRRWPEGFQEERLRFIHRGMSRSRANGFTGAPKLAKTAGGDTIVNLDGVLFEAQGWLAGETLSRRSFRDEPLPNVVTPLPMGILSSLADATGHFHLATKTLAVESEDEKRTIRAHFDEVARDVKACRETLLANARSRSADEERTIALRWLGLLPDALARAEAALRRNPTDALSASVLCHGDLWSAHAHFEGERFVGFTDFENVFLGSPSSDLAHLILHFNGWSSREAVLSAYEMVAPLSEADKRLLPVAAVADLAWESNWSLGSLYDDGHPLATAQREAHENNLRELLPSLEQVVAEFENAPPDL